MRGTRASLHLLPLLGLLAGMLPAAALKAAEPALAAPQPIALPIPIRAAIPAPYGIDRGTCDREPLSRAATDGPGAVAPGPVSEASASSAPATAPIAVGGIMAPADQLCVAQALEYAPDRRAVRWIGTQGQEWTVAPQETFERDGVYCRTFQATGQLQDRPSQFTNTACRGADGLWHAAG